MDLEDYMASKIYKSRSNSGDDTTLKHKSPHPDARTDPNNFGQIMG